MFRNKNFTMSITVFLIVLLAGVFATGSALAGKGKQGLPLTEDISWSSAVQQTRTLQLNALGDTIELPGVVYTSQDAWQDRIPSYIYEYYSNANLMKMGWGSFNAFQDENGAHFVFYKDSGYYLAVDEGTCDGTLCVSVWLSENESKGTTTLAPAEEGGISVMEGFTKLTPEDNATGIDPYSTQDPGVQFTWAPWTPNGKSAQQYSYCVYTTAVDTIDQNCGSSDPNWTNTANKYVTIPGAENGLPLNQNTEYGWKVRATICWQCKDKDWHYADANVDWTFTTAAKDYVLIKGTAKPGALITLTDNDDDSYSLQTTAKPSGNYDIQLHLTAGAADDATLTATIKDFTLLPATYAFNGETTHQLKKDFKAYANPVISGKVGVANHLLSFVGNGSFAGTDFDVITNSSGTYSQQVPYQWSGTITIADHVGYTFTPSLPVSVGPLTGNVTKNFASTARIFEITGHINYGDGGADLPNVVLKGIVNNKAYSTATNSTGDYILKLPYGWKGTITPTLTGYVFEEPTIVISGIVGDDTYADLTGYRFLTLTSDGATDGEVVEDALTVNAANANIRIGDTETDKQIKSFLSFNSTASGLNPAKTEIHSITMQLKKSVDSASGSPFDVLGDLNVGWKSPNFGTSTALAVADFTDTPTAAAGKVLPNLVADRYYMVDIDTADFDIDAWNQYSLSFDNTSDTDGKSDRISIFSGNNKDVKIRPTLVIRYWVNP